VRDAEEETAGGGDGCGDGSKVSDGGADAGGLAARSDTGLLDITAGTSVRDAQPVRPTTLAATSATTTWKRIPLRRIRAPDRSTFEQPIECTSSDSGQRQKSALQFLKVRSRQGDTPRWRERAGCGLR
jgi:hypothetical protein